MTSSKGETGRSNLADRVGIDTQERREMARSVVAQLERLGLHSVRLAFADQHGMLRGKTMRADLIESIMDNGVGITSALLMKDTGQNNVYPVWEPGSGVGESTMTGAGDVVMLPDPETFRVLPWTAGTGWVLCDLFTSDGHPVEFSTRRICARAEQQMLDSGYVGRFGLEVEFHLYQLDDAHLGVDDTRSAARRLELSHTHLGRVYLGERRFDQIEPFLDLLRDDLTALGLTPRSMEIELGPSQVELTFSPSSGLATADDAVLLREAVKQIAYRHGLHATFMARPNLTGSFSSGWHLHQSVVSPYTGENLFSPKEQGSLLAPIGLNYVSGLLTNASASCLLTTPTVTGYKRYQPQSLAPDRVAWGADNRGAMLRIIGGLDDPVTRIENRIGDSAANPYLYLTSQMLSGLAGIVSREDPAPPTTSPYEPAAGPLLPRSLDQAIEAFSASEFYRDALGSGFVDYLATIKRHEWQRFMTTVTDWEQDEYFELF